MKKKCFIFLCFTFFNIAAVSQDVGMNVKLGPVIAIGEFSGTHSIGAGIELGPSYHSFNLRSPKKLAFTYSGGFAWYHGRKLFVPDIVFDYPSYYLIHAFAGALYNPVKSVNITLQAGPALGLYRKDKRFNLAASFGGGYHFNANWSIHPSVWMMKESKSDPFYSGSLKIGYSF